MSDIPMIRGLDPSGLDPAIRPFIEALNETVLVLVRDLAEIDGLVDLHHKALLSFDSVLRARFGIVAVFDDDEDDEVRS